jgi:redox-sensitive bicupin YhaK (pirin superfamily)
MVDLGASEQFVMNTKEEILKSIGDYQNGNMGEIAIQ